MLETEKGPELNLFLALIGGAVAFVPNKKPNVIYQYQVGFLDQNT
jgi:hypothetical protein